MKTLAKILFTALLTIFISSPTQSSETIYSPTTDSSYFDLINYRQEKEVESVVKLGYVLDFGMFADEVSGATGFSVKYDKKNDLTYILTNNHFCAKADEIPIPGYFTYHKSDEIMDPTRVPIRKMAVVKTDPSLDLCLLVTKDKIPAVDLADKKYKYHQLEPITIIGAPNGAFPIMIHSTISNLVSRNFLPPEERNGDDLLLISDIVISGHSGSPVFNKHGQVVGVVFMGGTPVTTLYGGIAIPISDVHSFLDKINFK